MKFEIRKIISRLLMGAGAVLLIIGGGFELVNLPWRVILTKIGIPVSEELPDPKPLPEKLTGLSYQPGEQDAAELPDTTERIALRADIPLEQLGVLKYPRLGITENIVEGAGDEMLYGIGHLPGTEMPGEPGNCVLPGHRNFVVMHPFMHLDMAQEGDRVFVTYQDQTFQYEVYQIFSVVPEEVWVTVPQEGETAMLTLLTCSPGLNPTHRVVVWCRLVEGTEETEKTQ